MRAAVTRETNGKTTVEEVELSAPGDNQVLVDIKATGVCHSDLSFQNGTVPQRFPAILGHEGAGVVAATGSNITNISVGDHVIVNWSPFCGQCFFCMRGQTNLCSGGGRAGGRGASRKTAAGESVGAAVGSGTFAEQTVLGPGGYIKIAPDVPFEIAALVGCGVTTGAGAAMNTAKVQPGSTVVVIGCGGVGINVIQGAKVCGASVIVAVDKVESKLETAKRFGATHGSTPENLRALSAEVTGGVGFDYAFEAIGLSQTIRAAYDAARRGGTVTVIGMGSFADQVSFSAFELFFSEKKILGSYYGSAKVDVEFDKILGLWRGGQMDLEGLISRRLTLDDVDDAFEAMKAGDVIRQVLVL